MNVVLHEFARKLDMENGSVDGLPRLRPGMSRQAWADAFAHAYEDFCAEVDARRGHRDRPLRRRASRASSSRSSPGLLRNAWRAQATLPGGPCAAMLVLWPGSRRARAPKATRAQGAPEPTSRSVPMSERKRLLIVFHTQARQHRTARRRGAEERATGRGGRHRDEARLRCRH